MTPFALDLAQCPEPDASMNGFHPLFSEPSTSSIPMPMRMGNGHGNGNGNGNNQRAQTEEEDYSSGSAGPSSASLETPLEAAFRPYQPNSIHYRVLPQRERRNVVLSKFGVMPLMDDLPIDPSE